MTHKIPSGFDSMYKIEGEPTDEIGSRLLDHISLEAFTNGRDEPGNYIIEIRTTLPDNLAERERIARALGINISDNAMLHVPNEFSEPIIPRIGFELRNSMVLCPRPLGDPPGNDTARTLGIGAEWWREGRMHTLRIGLSVGTAAISQGIDRLGITSPQAYEAPETQYETEELAKAVETGRALVCKRPDRNADIDASTAFLWPLHDNVFHLYSNILLQTPEFTAFVRTHGANRRPGELDGDLAAAGAQLHRMSAEDWYSFTTTTQAPYRRFRHFLRGFIDTESEGATRLSQELDAMEKVDEVLKKADLNDAALALLDANRAIMDRPDSMLDQLDPVVSSIIARFVRLNPR